MLGRWPMLAHDSNHPVQMLLSTKVHAVLGSVWGAHGHLCAYVSSNRYSRLCIYVPPAGLANAHRAQVDTPS